MHARAGKLLAVATSIVNRLEIAGSPFEVLDGVVDEQQHGRRVLHACPKRGDLAYVPGTAEGGRANAGVGRSCGTRRAAAAAAGVARLSASIA